METAGQTGFGIRGDGLLDHALQGLERLARRMIKFEDKKIRPTEQYTGLMPKRYDAGLAATELLEECWDGTLPVDPVHVARTMGVKVLDASLDDDVSGALVKKEGADPSILLNAGDSRNRRRFTCAHELGHFIRRTDEPHKYEYVDYRDQRSSTGTDEEEMFANSFAANLLMPEPLVKTFHEQELPDFRMAKKFGVSQEAMQFRLKNLGLSK
jgi:Zn-dependent peptidase ImmA (M78 family)